MTILEAYAVRTPVVVTSLGGLPELVEHERTGLVVLPADPAGLARAMSRLHTDPDLAKAMGAGGRARLERDFGPLSHLESLSDVYQRAVAHRNGRSVRPSRRTAWTARTTDVS